MLLAAIRELMSSTKYWSKSLPFHLSGASGRPLLWSHSVPRIIAVVVKRTCDLDSKPHVSVRVITIRCVVGSPVEAKRSAVPLVVPLNQLFTNATLVIFLRWIHVGRRLVS